MTAASTAKTRGGRRREITREIYVAACVWPALLAAAAAAAAAEMRFSASLSVSTVAPNSLCQASYLAR